MALRVSVLKRLPVALLLGGARCSARRASTVSLTRYSRRTCDAPATMTIKHCTVDLCLLVSHSHPAVSRRDASKAYAVGLLARRDGSEEIFSCRPRHRRLIASPHSAAMQNADSEIAIIQIIHMSMCLSYVDAATPLHRSFEVFHLHSDMT